MSECKKHLRLILQCRHYEDMLLRYMSECYERLCLVLQYRHDEDMFLRYTYKCYERLCFILQYRHYEDMLLRYKSWCMVWIIICIVPFGMLVIESGLNLNWANMAAQVFIAPFITPLFLTIGWAGAKSQVLIAGKIL